MIAISIFILLWLASGALSFIYWWTKEFDFTSEEIAFCMFISIGGPITFIGGWIVHGDELLDSRRVLLRRRGNK
jgi:hypothetical protein